MIFSLFGCREIGLRSASMSHFSLSPGALLTKKMSLRPVFVFVNFKAIFCLIFAVTLAKYVYTQNLYTAMLDETRNTLMSFSSGSSTPSPTPSPKTPVRAHVVHRLLSGKSSLSIPYLIFCFRLHASELSVIFFA